MNTIDHFVGGQFSWFTGVVEDILDPKEMGRVRVRCFGYHSENKEEIATEDLPWAVVMTPIQSASMSGIGHSATGILQGSWVVGFFRDGPSAQDPIVLGTIPSISSEADTTKGFADPDGKYPLPALIGEPDMPQEARSVYKDAPAYIIRNDLRQEDIETAIPPKVESVVPAGADSYYERKTWSVWDVDQVASPVYPMNHVYHSESGHVREVDDTPYYSRIMEMHRSGTYTEINNGGDKTTTIVGDNYVVVLGNDNIYIKGSANITVDGDLRQLIKGNYHIEVEGNKTEYIKGTRQSKIGQSEHIEIGQDYASNVINDRISRIGGNTTIIRDGNKDETIAGNSDVLVNGNDGHIVIGERQEYTGSHFECTTTGHLIVVSNEFMSLSSASTLEMDITGNVTQTFGAAQTVNVTGAVSETIGGNQSTSVSGTQTMSISGTQSITASVTNIGNNVNVTGVLAATSNVTAGATSISLTTHKHVGVQTGLGLTGLPQ